MSNKLVKSKSNMEKKLEYYKRHCRTLEKEIGMLQAEKENLKKENVELQLKLGIDLEHIKQNNTMDRKVIANALYSQKLFNDGKAEMKKYFFTRESLLAIGIFMFSFTHIWAQNGERHTAPITEKTAILTILPVALLVVFFSLFAT